jgi:hypothetical protein
MALRPPIVKHLGNRDYQSRNARIQLGLDYSPSILGSMSVVAAFSG